MGLEFGHDLGPRRALRGLPVSPLVTGYRHLVAQQRALGFRHIGDALVERGRVLRVLDGVFEERAGRRWHHIGADRLHQMGAAHGGAYRPFLALLEAVQLQDPAALRRVLLYQLAELLQAHPQGTAPGTAVALGVCPTEAAALVRATAACHRLTGEQRRAAEELADAWENGQVRRAARLAALLPAGGGDDALLRRRRADIAARVAEADDALDAAREAERSGDARAAQDGFLDAARLASDCPRARLALVRLHRPAGNGNTGPGGVLTARHASETVSVSLRPSPPDADAGPERRAVRLTRVPGGPTRIAEIAGGSPAAGWVDRNPPFGQEVRYAVFPLRDGRIDGPPVVSDVLLVAPDVSALRSATGPGRIDASWTEPSEALGVQVVLEGPDGPVAGVEVRTGALTATGLEAGAHVLRIRCRYRSPDGTVIESAGADHHVTVRPWPAPVHRLDATVGQGSVQFSWSGGQDADVRLVSLAGRPAGTGDRADPRPGAALARPVVLAAGGGRPGASPGLGHPGVRPGCARTARGGGSEPPRRVPARGGRGACGTGLRRPGPHHLRLAGGDGPGRGHRGTGRRPLRAPRDAQRLRPGGDVRGRDVLRLLRLPLRRTPDGGRGARPSPGGDTRVMADIVVSYRVVPGPRRGLRRGPALLRVSLSCPGEVPDGLPEFVLVARTAGGRDPIRPLNHTDGTPLLRLDGSALSVGRPVELPLPTSLRPPCVLRGFLIGDGAAAVRLDEPSPTTLVVR